MRIAPSTALFTASAMTPRRLSHILVLAYMAFELVNITKYQRMRCSSQAANPQIRVPYRSPGKSALKLTEKRPLPCIQPSLTEAVTCK